MRRLRLPLAATSACCALVLSLSPTAPLAAQEALVLSGGGGRGLAHAGVIVGLDSLGYDPDIVAGTSMGAILGALYASGLDARAIEDTILSTDWLDLFTAYPAPAGPMRELLRPTLRPGFGGGTAAASGLVPDWRVNRRLVELLFDAGARARGDFDRLPRRFRAVTADLGTGRAVVLASGDLARAVRASMGVPGFFPPIRTGGRWLVDGGVADQLPVDVAVAMGAERVIASDVTRPDTLDALDPLGVGIRAFRLLLENARPPAPPPDVLVLPDIPTHVSAAIFPADPRPLLRAGLDAALRTLPPAEGTRRRLRAPAPAPRSFEALRVSGADSGLVRFAREIFDDIAPGPYDAAAVFAAADRLYATGLVAGVWPTVERDSNGTVLAVRVDPMPPIALNATAGYSNDGGGRVRLGMSRRLPGPAQAAFEASLDGTERWAALSARRLFAAPNTWALTGGIAFRRSRLRADRSLPGGARVERAGGWIGGEWRGVGPDRIATVSFTAERVRAPGRTGGSYGPLVRLTLPEPPSSPVGGPTELLAEWRFGSVAYHRIRARGSLPVRLGRLRLAATADAAFADADAPPDVTPALGDARAFPGLRRGEERGAVRVAGGFDVAWPIFSGGYVRARLRAGANAPRADDLDRARWRTGAGIGMIWPTVLGPFAIEAAVATRAKWRIDLDLGPVF